jgi:hypothetical protein
MIPEFESFCCDVGLAGDGTHTTPSRRGSSWGRG